MGADATAVMTISITAMASAGSHRGATVHLLLDGWHVGGATAATSTVRSGSFRKSRVVPRPDKPCPRLLLRVLATPRLLLDLFDDLVKRYKRLHVLVGRVLLTVGDSGGGRV